MTFLNPKNPAAVLFLTDAYKLDHRRQYPDATEAVYANFTNRGSRIEGIKHVVHFGLQAFIRDVLMNGFDTFFRADEDEVAEAYEKRVTALLGPNEIGSDHIRALHRLGYVPLEFRAVAEGTPVPLRVPSFTVENTLPEFFWVTNYIETVLSSHVWQPSTSATTAWYMRRIFDKAAEETGGALAGVDFQGHDFSYRGMPGTEAASASGAGHLLSFKGTDSLSAIDWIDYYYEGDNGLVGASVPASEHSVMCANGKEGELSLLRKFTKLYPTGIFSVVCDTWDLWKVLTEYLPEMKDEILARDGKMVIRPDSGDPVDIITGTLKFPEDKERWGDTPEVDTRTPEEKGVIELLWDLFGGTVNAKGFKELNSHIGMIYGDSINPERAKLINDRLAAKGFASTNWVAGIGSFTYQYVTRDTFMSAIKATWVRVFGEGRNIMKDPITDSGMKKSATGRLAVLAKRNGSLELIQQATPEQEAQSVLTTLWRNGRFAPGAEMSFASVRANLEMWTKVLVANGDI